MPLHGLSIGLWILGINLGSTEKIEKARSDRRVWMHFENFIDSLIVMLVGLPAFNDTGIVFKDDNVLV